MPRELRPYQANALSEVSRHFREGHRRVLVCCPTGGGKTFIASNAAKTAVERGKRVLWVAHRSELVDQAAKELREVTGKRVGIFQGGRKSDPGAMIQVASIQTLIRREEIPPADLVIGDEAHRMLAEQWHSLLETYKQSYFIYLTATPERGDGKPLGDLATALVPTVQPSELIADGVLVPCEIISPNFEIKGGISDDPVEAYLRWGKKRRAIFFCQSKEHAALVSEGLTAHGIPNGVVTDNTPWATRKAIYRRVSDGTLKALVNVLVGTEGLDIPPLAVCVLARTAGHSSMFIQMVGRVMRSCRGKDSALIIDLKGVVAKYGSPERDRTYSLEGDEAVSIDKGDMAILKCKDCGSLKTSPICPVCGFQATVERQLVPDIVSHEMQVVSRLDHSDDAARFYIRTIHEMMTSKVRNFSREATNAFHARYGCYPSPEWMALYRDYLTKKLYEAPEWWPAEIALPKFIRPVAAE